ncbi:hypothetical protein HNP86_001967 [Methanococcus maripaludis]|uniref:Uncharacterized protein n=1 Tax=Methanococcus maripaludis TaxID=39152 RepID=A0A7J9NVU5_METMI|nr:hypothetical protein [Methanococcus maripaludis]
MIITAFIADTLCIIPFVAFLLFMYIPYYAMYR